MPHAHAAAVVHRLLRRLASDARRLELPPNTDGDLGHVRRTLVSLQDVLHSLEIRPEAQEWMGNIKQVAYDVEDLLDDFENHSSIESQTSRCIAVAEAIPFCHSCSSLLHSTRTNRMKAIRRRLELSTRDSVIFSLMQYPCPDVVKFDSRVFDGGAVIGRDNDKAKIKDMLLQSSAENLSVIPIVGLAGLGKTSLARLIFRDHGEAWNFDLRIWICLNRKLDLKKVAGVIISQFNHTENLLDAYTDIEIQDNLQYLKNCLQDMFSEKSCLIVLDDLSSTDKNLLNELKEMLKGTNECTKVLVTTSCEITAELVHTIPPYKLQPLSEDDCWTVFSQKAFGNCSINNAQHKEIGKQIVKRCEGIPILAHSLGSFVQNHITNVWLAARDEELWKLERRFATKIEVFSPLYRIYYDLPSTIKLCFLYLSVFPKGSIIDKEKLIEQWKALEIIGSKHDSLPSYVHGEMCIQDLLSAHFLQVQNIHSVDGINNRLIRTTLIMHNFVHEFSRHVSCDDTIILDGSEMQKDYTKRQTFQYALLTCYRGQSTFSHSLLTRTRALHVTNSEAVTFHSEVFELLKHLRVLNLSGCCIRELPASIGHLKHLKYLDVSGVQIQTLPSPMNRLTNLEVLDLSKSSIKELPSFISSFQNLKYLNMQGCDKLENLPSALGHLKGLEHLHLSCCNNIIELPDSMSNLHGLKYLDLSRCTELQHLPPLFGDLVNLEDLCLFSCFSLKQLPESFGNLYFLRFLNLSGCYELQQLPESFTNLKKLEVLMLQRCCRLQDLPPSFATIKDLRILNLAGCEELNVSTDMLTTTLEHLNLQQCLKLQTQPHCFDNFSKLKFLNLSQCVSTIDCLKSVSFLSNLEHLNLSGNFLDIPVSFARLQKLHTLDLTCCPPIHQFSSVDQILAVADIISKLTSLRFVLTKDPLLVSCLPRRIQCSVGIGEHGHITTDELVITDITGGSRGLSIAQGLNLQNRLELRFLKLEWLLNSHSDGDDFVGDDEVLEKLQPNQNLECFELIKYTGYAFPTWMTNNMITSLPYLVRLCLFHLQNTHDLPPLGQLRNLRYLHIKDIPKLEYLEMGLSGGTQPFKKLMLLKLEALVNLEELSIFVSNDSENKQFMFPALVELVVLSCSQLTFKPSLPRCMRYEIRDSNNILSCGQPLGPSSSPSPRNIEISGCLVPSSWLQWLKSLQTLKKLVIDGAELTCFDLPEIKRTQESSNADIPHETTHESSSGTNIQCRYPTQGVVPDTGSGSSIIRKLLPKFNSTLAHSVDPGSSWKVSTPSKETPSTFQNLSGFKMSTEIPRVKSLSLKQIQKATRKFSPSFMLGEGSIWTAYKAVLPDNHIVVVRRPKKGCIQHAKNFMKPELLTNFNHWSLVGFLGFIDKGREFLMISEYVSNGTLREHLDGQDERFLDFNQRVVIAIDVAIALTYLHVSSEEPVICNNLKTAKILLTESCRAKVCAYELSGCGPSESVTGTIGYIDPEYLQTRELTAKSDVFSFGIILLELISSRNPLDYLWHNNNRSIGEWAFETFNQGHVNEILDYRLKGEVDEKVLRDWLSLALRCASYSSRDRPNIEEAGGRLWKIWKDHRSYIGEPYEYQRSWAEFFKMGGIPMADESMCEGTEEAYTVHCLSRPGSPGSPDSMTISPRPMEPVPFARERNMPSDSDRTVNEDKRFMSCSMPWEHQKFFEVPVSSVRELHLQSDEPSTSEANCSRGRTISEDLFAPRTRSLSPIPKGHAFAVSNGYSREFGFSPRSLVRKMDGLRSPPHPLPLPPASAACSPLLPASAACSPLHPASGACSPLHPASGACSPLPPTHSPCSPLPSSPSSCPPLSASPTTFSQSQSQWKKGNLLGSGTFGQVYLGFNSENGQFCAIKEVEVIMDDPHSKERLKQLNQEIDMLRQLSHPNIVQYHGSELSDEALSIYLEYVSGGSIHKLLREYGPFKEPVIRNYTGQILAGLAYLHGRNTVHRDIKGANILVGPNGEVKLADFGMAKHISSFAEIRSFKGSPYWMAPEVIMNSKGYSLSVDIWSLGCTIIEMATARPPWHQYEGVAAIFKIANSKDIPEIPDSFSEEGKSFLQLCLKRDPASRPSAAQLMDHPFVQDHPAVRAAKSSALRNTLSFPAHGRHTMSNRDLPSRKIVTPLKDIGLSMRDFTGFSTAVPSPHSSPIPGRANMSMPVSPCSSPQRQFKQSNVRCMRSPPHPMLSPGLGNTLSYTQNQTRRIPAPAISDTWLDVGQMKLQSPNIPPKRF